MEEPQFDMSLIHDIIKLNYSRLGYLPNYPYHLISDREMFEAFIDLSYEDESSSSISSDDSSQDAPENSTVERFFDDMYPNPFLGEENDLYVEGAGGIKIRLRSEYCRLKQYIVTTINAYLEHCDGGDADLYTIPDWIYTYMLGEVIYNDSEYRDIYDLLQLLHANNIDNELTAEICKQCYLVSTRYISTLTANIRPPTVFGEPHVIKQLRLEV